MHREQVDGRPLWLEEIFFSIIRRNFRLQNFWNFLSSVCYFCGFWRIRDMRKNLVSYPKKYKAAQYPEHPSILKKISIKLGILANFYIRLVIFLYFSAKMGKSKETFSCFIEKRVTEKPFNSHIFLRVYLNKHVRSPWNWK